MVHVEPSQRTVLHEDHRVMLDAFLAGDTDSLLSAAAVHNKRLNAVVESLADRHRPRHPRPLIP